MPDRDFTVDVSVDRYALDEENERQAATYHYWAEELAEAKAERDEAEDALDVAEAKAMLAVADGTDKRVSALPKAPTVEVSKALVATANAVVEAKERLRKADSRVGKLEANVKALDHRKSMLSNLTELFIHSYYSAPSARSDGAGGDVRRDTRAALKEADRRRRDAKEE